MATADTAITDIAKVADAIGALVPTVAAIGSMIRLIATAVRPTDAQKAQAFDAAMVDLDKRVDGLNASIAAFDAAKAQANAQAAPQTGASQASAQAQPSGNAVGAMTQPAGGANVAPKPKP